MVVVVGAGAGATGTGGAVVVVVPATAGKVDGLATEAAVSGWPVAVADVIKAAVAADPPTTGALGGAAVAAVLPDADVEDGDGAGKKGTVDGARCWTGALASGTGAGPVPTATRAATMDTAAAAALNAAMVRSRNMWSFDAPAAATAAAAPAIPAGEALSGGTCPKPGDVKTSSRVA
ncbi:MAG TPA: hypothetical protein VHS57_04300 [Acidimicrobiales bacterium]|nr:hypothetical protein [Acidimicrobiales bacterium]